MTALSGKKLLRTVVYIIFAMGLASTALGLMSTLGPGAFSNQIFVGIAYMVLAIWLFRGSEIARALLAFLLFFGALFGLFTVVVLAGVRPLDFATIIYISVFTVVSALFVWLLVFSKKLKIELSLMSMTHAKLESDARNEYYKSLGTEYKKD